MTLAWDLEMQPTPKLVLLALCDWANDEGLCFPSVRSIARRACLSQRQSQRVMQSLVADRWIAVVGNENGGRFSRRYRISVDALRRGDTDVRGDNLTPPARASSETRHSRRPSGDTCDIPGMPSASPEPLVDPSAKPSTNHVNVNGLVWPHPLQSEDIVLVGSFIEPLDQELKQLVLDEMQGAFDQGKPPIEVGKWTQAVVEAAKSGKLNPTRALRVARKRRIREQEAADSKARQELSHEWNRSKTPEELARRRARADAAAKDLRR